jgi:disulfide bond formation protein DsbB
MNVYLFRKLNAIGLLAVSAVLAMAFYSQFTQAELPCPLCLLQRIAFAAVLCGLLLNVVKGPRSVHYSIMIVAALFGGAVSLRQVSLHIVPGTGSYGAPFLDMHYYTWAFMVFALIIFGAAIIAAFSRQYHDNQFIRFREQSAIAKVAIVVAIVFVAGNAIAAFVECGPLQCPDDPSSYWLFG